MLRGSKINNLFVNILEAAIFYSFNNSFVFGLKMQNAFERKKRLLCTRNKSDRELIEY